MTDDTFIPPRPDQLPARYRTRDGSIVEVIAQGRLEHQVYVGFGENGSVLTWHTSGQWLASETGGRDLIGAPLPDEEEPEEGELWFVEYENMGGSLVYASRKKAEQATNHPRDAVHRLRTERFPVKGGGE